MMPTDTNPKQLCEQIRQIYPEVGECGIGVDVNYDEDKDAWIVSLSHEGKKVYTHLEPEDAQACVEGEQCLSLGTQIGQLVDNAKRTTRA